jgi:aspartate/methionine/tyrosine aminotransferase
MRIDTFEMERMQSLYWHEVEYDLSESGVQPLTIRELLGERTDPQAYLDTALGYPLSEGSEVARERIAQWYPGCRRENVTIVNGGSEANFLTLWTLLEPGDRLAFMVPNYMQGWGLGRQFGAGTDPYRLRLREGDGPGRRWALDPGELERVVGPDTRVIWVTNPNNPTGAILAEDEMDAIVAAARRARAWIVADEIYRGAELDGRTSPTFWGRYERVIVTGGLSKAFGLPGLRIGWAVAPPPLIRRLWVHHDYTTLTPGMLSARLAERAMEPGARERIFARTRSILRENLPVLEEWIGNHGDLFHYVPPRAGAIAYLRYRLPVDSIALVNRLRRERSVLLCAGGHFGMGKYLRIGYGDDQDTLRKGLDRVTEGIRDHPS